MIRRESRKAGAYIIFTSARTCEFTARANLQEGGEHETVNARFVTAIAAASLPGEPRVFFNHVVVTQHDIAASNISSIRALVPKPAIDTVCEPRAKKLALRDIAAAQFSVYFCAACAAGSRCRKWARARCRIPTFRRLRQGSITRAMANGFFRRTTAKAWRSKPSMDPLPHLAARCGLIGYSTLMPDFLMSLAYLSSSARTNAPKCSACRRRDRCRLAQLFYNVGRCIALTSSALILRMIAGGCRPARASSTTRSPRKPAAPLRQTSECSISASRLARAMASARCARREPAEIRRSVDAISVSPAIR